MVIYLLQIQLFKETPIVWWAPLPTAKLFTLTVTAVLYADYLMGCLNLETRSDSRIPTN